MERLPELSRRLAKIRESIGKVVFTQPLSSHGDHFQSKIPFEEELPIQPEFWDEHGYPVYPREPHHTKDNFVMNRDEEDLGWKKN